MIKLKLTFNNGETFEVWAPKTTWVYHAIKAVNYLGYDYDFMDLKFVNDKSCTEIFNNGL